MILNETVAAIADAIREKTGKSELIAPVDFAEEIKGITSGGGESASTIEYLDLSGDSPLREVLISFCYLIKTDGFNVENTNGSGTSAPRGIVPAANLTPSVVGMTYDGYSIILNSIKAVAIDFNTEVVMQDTLTPIKVIFTGVDELLNAIPRLTKEQFYDLNA